MAKNQTFFNFKRGDVVDAWGDLAVVIDVLRSEFTDNVTVYVRFEQPKTLVFGLLQNNLCEGLL